jgi:hypothetical protein
LRSAPIASQIRDGNDAATRERQPGVNLLLGDTDLVLYTSQCDEDDCCHE